MKGYLDGIAVSDVNRFEQQYLDDLRAKGGDILEAIRNDKQLTEETEKKLASFLDDFSKKFA